MKILFIGGNGNISWYCVQEALRLGYKVTILHRGFTEGTRRKTPDNVVVLHADYRDEEQTYHALKYTRWDAVVDFLVYNKRQAARAVEIFRGITNRYYFISTTSVYERGSRNIPYKEDSPIDPNPIREYTRNKIAAEKVFMDAFHMLGFPVVIVRPGYTYDTIVPVSCGLNDWTVPQRMIEGKPAIILGDGSNLATFTHSRDFATGLMGLMCQDYPSLLGQAFNITGDEVRTWREATDILAKLLLITKGYSVLYIPTDRVVKKLRQLLTPIPAGEMSFNPSVTQSLSRMAEDFEGQKMWCELFDNSKLKRLLPRWKPDTTLESGLRETITWLLYDSTRRRFDYALNNVLDALVQSERGRYEQL